MERLNLKLIGNLQIETAYSALQTVGAQSEDMPILAEHLKMNPNSVDDLKGQVVRNTAIFTGHRGQVLKHMIMRGIEKQLAEPATSEKARWQKVAAMALREVLAQENQDAR